MEGEEEGDYVRVGWGSSTMRDSTVDRLSSRTCIVLKRGRV